MDKFFNEAFQTTDQDFANMQGESHERITGV